MYTYNNQQHVFFWSGLVCSARTSDFTNKEGAATEQRAGIDMKNFLPIWTSQILIIVSL